jgi:hypothetical protein
MRISCCVLGPKAVRMCASRISSASSTNTTPGDADWMADANFAAPVVVQAMILLLLIMPASLSPNIRSLSGRVEFPAVLSNLCYQILENGCLPPIDCSLPDTKMHFPDSGDFFGLVVLQ